MLEASFRAFLLVQAGLLAGALPFWALAAALAALPRLRRRGGGPEVSTPGVSAPEPPAPSSLSEGAPRSAPDARERRVREGEARERVRSALRALPSRGYYAWEDLLVDDVGTIDQLVLGPDGAFMIIVGADEGFVWRAEDGGLYVCRAPERSVETNEVVGGAGEPLEEDLDELAAAFARELGPKLFGDHGPRRSIFCFPNAEVNEGSGVVSVWRLVEAIMHEEGPDDLPEGAQEAAAELAEIVSRDYGREPWLRPADDEEPFGDA